MEGTPPKIEAEDNSIGVMVEKELVGEQHQTVPNQSKPSTTQTYEQTFSKGSKFAASLNSQNLPEMKKYHLSQLREA